MRSTSCPFVGGFWLNEDQLGAGADRRESGSVAPLRPPGRLQFPLAFPLIAIKKQSSEAPQAFTMMHELAHLLLHRKSFVDDEDDFYSYRGNEKDANEFAGYLLVPDDLLKQMDVPHFPVRDVTTDDNYL